MKMEILKELEAIKWCLDCVLIDDDTNGSQKYIDQALTTLDRILNQDEAEMVERVAKALVSYRDSRGEPMAHGDCGGLAQAPLRALGLMKEGE